MLKGPKPSIDFTRQVAERSPSPLTGGISGEIAVTKRGQPLGVARSPGRVSAVNFSLLGCGKDDSSVPTLSVDVRINGVSCLTTPPAIAHVSGEAAQQKTTFASAADTGITQGVVNTAANSYSKGDVFTWDAVYSGNASPTTKAHNLTMIVEVVPTE